MGRRICDGLVEKSVMQEAWKVACVDKMSVENVRRARQGGAAAHWDASAMVGLSAPAYDVFKVRDGHLLRFGSCCIEEGTHEADPSLIRALIRDDYEQAVLVDPQVANGLADVKGLRGYARSEVAISSPASQALTAEEGVGMPEASVAAAKLWRRGKFKHVDDRPLPLLWPVPTVFFR